MPDSRLPDVRRLGRWTRQARPRHLLASDGLGLFLAALVLVADRTDGLPGVGTPGAYLSVVGIIVLAQLAVNVRLGLYASSWRFAAVRGAWRILGSTLAGTALAALIVLAITSLRPNVIAGVFPAAFWVMEATLALGVLAAPRLMIRLASELSEREETRNGRQRTLLYGAGWAGVIAARSAEHNPGAGVTPVGFLDDDPGLVGSRAGGLPVFGDASAIAVARRQTGASALLITMPYSTGADVRRVVDAAMKHGLTVRTVPNMTELLDRTLDVTEARPVRVEDLLRWQTTAEPSPVLEGLVKGRAVVITGAAGQIGSELARQVLVLRPGRIVMVDLAERALSAVARELQASRQVAEGTTKITTHLVDVTDREAIAELIRRIRPAALLHAAALTQVPMLEEHAAQATRVNIGGTKSLIDAAIDCGVERFVLASTDKAFQPSNVMGASMRIAEMVVRDAARRTGGAFASVRFGELLGTSGSAIPTMRSQLESGQPLAVTNSESRCYPMSTPEASRLILEAAARPEPGCLYLLDRGTPVRIEDVASDLIWLSGRDPDSVPITIVGPRPEEKPHEKARHGEDSATPTDIPRVLRSTADQATPVTIRADVKRFLALARDGRDDVLRTDLLRYVRSATSEDANLARHRYRPVVPVPVRSSGKGVRPLEREPGTIHAKVVIKPPAVGRVTGSSAGVAARTRQRGRATGL